MRVIFLQPLMGATVGCPSRNLFDGWKLDHYYCHIFCLQLLSLLSLKSKVQTSVWQVRKGVHWIDLGYSMRAVFTELCYYFWQAANATKTTIAVKSLQATRGDVSHLGSTMGLSRLSNSLVGTSSSEASKRGGVWFPVKRIWNTVVEQQFIHLGRSQFA